MQSSTLEFPHNARTVYTAVKHLFEMRRTKFSAVKFNDDLFIVEARRGAWISPFTENVRLRVAATGWDRCKVVVESSSRSILNLLNFGANIGNVSDLSDWISNEVYRLQNVTYVDKEGNERSASEIRIVEPDIKFAQNINNNLNDY